MSSPSQKTADQWNRQLRYFRFYFAHGGHANDMDMLSAGIRFAPTETGLLEVFACMGIELQRIPASMPRREVGRTYNSDDRDKYADPIRAYPAFACPAFVSIEGMPAHLDVAADRIRIAILSGRRSALFNVVIESRRDSSTSASSTNHWAIPSVVQIRIRSS